MSKKESKVKELSDEELIAFIRKKHLESYREIVRRYQKKLFVYIYRLVQSKEEAEDILQNVFVKTYKNMALFDAEKKFSSWIYRIAHNEAVNYLKKRGRKKFISWEDVTNENRVETKSEEKSPLESWISRESREEIEKALRVLPKKYQDVLKMRYFEEKTYGEIGRIIKKPVNTVGTLINRAKKRLFQIMKEKK